MYGHIPASPRNGQIVQEDEEWEYEYQGQAGQEQYYEGEGEDEYAEIYVNGEPQQNAYNYQQQQQQQAMPPMPPPRGEQVETRPRKDTFASSSSESESEDDGEKGSLKDKGIKLGSFLFYLVGPIALFIAVLTMLDPFTTLSVCQRQRTFFFMYQLYVDLLFVCLFVCVGCTKLFRKFQF